VGLGASAWLLTRPTTLAFCLSSTHFFTTRLIRLGLPHPIVAYLLDVSVVIPLTI